MSLIVVLTGAGISAESGIPTFRDAGGLWEGHKVEDVATPQGYKRDPGAVDEFYRARRAAAAAATPNAAHIALAALAADLGDDMLVVTQNVDDLHERAGHPTDRLVHMHGQLDTAICTLCKERQSAGFDFGDQCPVCRAGRLRPDVVWFGERPYEMGRVQRAVESCRTFIAIGTSGEVYPAAGFVSTARDMCATTIEVNLQPTSHLFGRSILGPASTTVLKLAAELRGSLL